MIHAQEVFSLLIVNPISQIKSSLIPKDENVLDSSFSNIFPFIFIFLISAEFGISCKKGKRSFIWLRVPILHVFIIFFLF